jgi:hypothetical protein
MITVEDIAKELNTDFSPMTQSEVDYFKEVASVALNLSAQEKTVLRACQQSGPLEDGDVPSKSGRDQLLDKGFVAKVIVKGEQGYNACTYRGHLALQVVTAKMKLHILDSGFTICKELAPS